MFKLGIFGGIAALVGIIVYRLLTWLLLLSGAAFLLIIVFVADAIRLAQ